VGSRSSLDTVAIQPAIELQLCRLQVLTSEPTLLNEARVFDVII
jgi:hypothetical protein